MTKKRRCLFGLRHPQTLALCSLAVGCAKVLGFEPGELPSDSGASDPSRGGAGAGRNDSQTSRSAGTHASGESGGESGGEAGTAGSTGGGQGGEAVNEPTLCGNQRLDRGEECDGAELGGETCASKAAAAGGRLGCNAQCKYYKEGCYHVRQLDVSAHACAVLSSNERLKCWGSNYSGQLGLGDTDDRGEESGEMGDQLPFVDLGGRRVVNVSTGGSHTCAHVEGNEVLCWGSNADGQLGVSGGDVSDPSTLSPVNLGDDVVKQVAAGGSHSCVLFTTGKVKCWGRNAHGQLGLGHSQPRGKLLGEMENLPFVDTGVDANGDPTVVNALDAGDEHTCVVTSHNTVKCWGFNGQGQLGIASFEENRGEAANEMGERLPASLLGFLGVAHLSAGGVHNCVKTSLPELKCWGSNGEGQLGYGDYESRGHLPKQMGESLQSVQWGSGLFLDGVSSGSTHTCAWFYFGAGVKCWGSNSNGELGLGDTDSRGYMADQMGDNLPIVNLGTGHVVKSVHAGPSVTCAVLDVGRVKCWGSNYANTLGAGHRNHIGVLPEQMGDALPFVSL